MLRVPLDAECKHVSLPAKLHFLSVHNRSFISNNWQCSGLLSARAAEPRLAMLLRLHVLSVKSGVLQVFQEDLTQILESVGCGCTESSNSCLSVNCTAV